MPPKEVWLIELNDGKWIATLSNFDSIAIENVKSAYRLDLNWRLHEPGSGSTMQDMRTPEERSQVNLEPLQEGGSVGQGQV